MLDDRRRAIELDPTRDDAAVTLGYTYEQRGLLAQALHIYRNASSADPAWRDVLIARIYALSGNRTHALALLRAAPRPHDVVHVALDTAGLLALLGKHRAAVALLAGIVRQEGHVEIFTQDPRLWSMQHDRELARLDAAQTL